MAKSILIACHELVLSGGMLRFERFGREAMLLGHKLSFLVMSERPESGFDTHFPVLNFEQASAQNWDVTMVPGQGFPKKTIEAFSKIVCPNFGLRIQHILNDRTLESGFLNVNCIFRPDIVIFNNQHWGPGDFTGFQARKFYYLEGAVDPKLFHPKTNNLSSRKKCETKWIVGTQAKLSALEPIIEALFLLPELIQVRVFGSIPAIEGSDAEKVATLVELGRLVFLGQLSEGELLSFYDGCDIVIHTELYAGWANMVAEAMSCGVPVICTASGTLSMAFHMETALLLPEATAKAIAESIQLLIAHDELRFSLATNARIHISKMSWKIYTKKLLSLCDDDGASHYTLAPELGLFGKWPLENRFEGLNQLLESCEGKTVLDLGCAEGVIARKYLQEGVSLLHGFEIDQRRVDEARKLCKDFPQALFRNADLSNWSSFLKFNSDVLLDTYDFVLYLGLHHHLPAESRVEILSSLLSLAKESLIIRTPSQLWVDDNMEVIIRNAGFEIEWPSGKEIQEQGILAICCINSINK